MSYRFPQNWPKADPTPNVPTLAEIQFADELRYRLELRLLPSTEARARRFGAVEYDWGRSTNFDLQRKGAVSAKAEEPEYYQNDDD
jgi:hypothetical protein